MSVKSEILQDLGSMSISSECKFFRAELPDFEGQHPGGSAAGMNKRQVTFVCWWLTPADQLWAVVVA